MQKNRLRSTTLATLVGLAGLAAFGCSGAGETPQPTGPAADGLAASRAGGLRVVAFPSDDPGPPLYVRLTPMLNQIFVDQGMVAIPFYRDPACVPADTDMLTHFHPPGPGGPGAFGCRLLIEGTYVIESDAPLGTFPVSVNASGPARVWFVPVSDFAAATADGVLTMAELVALEPLRGTATSFHEMLKPRTDTHHVVITSRGRLEDGRTFQFNVNHQGDVTRSILIRIG